MKDKYLFLDVDDVLNYSEHGNDTYYDQYEDLFLALDISKVKMLKKLFDDWPDLKTVFISDWRYRPYIADDYRVNPCKFLRQFMPWLNVAGDAPTKMSSDHWHDVKWWLDEHESDCYVILDDLSYPKKFPSCGMRFDLSMHCITPDYHVGLTEKDVKAASYLLWQQDTHNKNKKLSADLWHMQPGKTYIFNNRYECKFSFEQEQAWDNTNTLFGEWHPLDVAKSANVSEVTMQAYDIQEGKYLDALVQLQSDRSLTYACQEQATLFLKEVGDKTWKNMTQIQSMMVK